MSKISRDDVLRLAKLSNIKLDNDEIDRLAGELGAIVEYVEQIDNVDVTGLKSTDQVTGLKNVMREDEILEYEASPKQLLKNAPEVEKNQIKVKRILD